ncbi:Solute carrier family 22 member 5 [Halotydeus destructor]|nr:Solute carrier family 22 member 5 [Halotydeus destructor]
MAEDEPIQEPKVKKSRHVSSVDAIFANHIGNGGKFQYLLIGYITLLIGPMIGFNLTNQLLILLIPPHECSDAVFQLPLTTVGNSTALTLELNSLSENSSFDSCDKQLVVHVAEVTFDTKYSFRCYSKKEFDHSIVYPTLVSENEWVCQDRHKALMPHVVFRGGSVLGVLLIGVMSDRFGRIPTSMVCFLISGLANIASIFAGSNFTAFMICRALVGFVSFKGMIPIILVTEFVGPKERAYVANGLQLSIGLTSITLPWIAYFVRDWRIMMAVTSGSMLLVPVISCFIPESVRWLLSRGGEESTEKAKGILSKIARINGRDIPVDVLDGLKAEKNKYLFFSLLFLGRLGVTIVYNVKYLYAVELFPTAIRARALAVRLSFGCIGGLLSPYVLLMNFSGKSSPLVFYGAMCLVTSALMCFLPETRDAALPDTLAEANDFGLTKDTGDSADSELSGELDNRFKRRQSLAVAIKRASVGPEIKYRDSVDFVYSTRRMSIYH